MQEEEKIEEYIKDFGETEDKGQKSRLAGFLTGRYFVPVMVILVAASAFSLGRVSGLGEKREPVRIINNSPPNPSLNIREGSSANSESGEVQGAATQSAAEAVVASKNGTKYHYPWCSGAKQIAEKNKITFGSIEEARATGYTPAANCKGLK